MFQEPHKHVIIAFTKARIAQNDMEEEEIVDIALGKNGEQRNFSQFKVIRVE